MTHGGGSGPTVIEGRIHRALNNRLDLPFRDGPDEPFAVGRQDAGSVGKKLGALFGFKNGGTGSHVLSVGERTIGVISRDGAPTDLTDGVGGPVIATIERGDTARAVDSAGRTVVVFVDRPAEEQTVRQWSMELRGPDDTVIGRLDVLRVWIDWTVNKVLDAEITIASNWDRAGQGLKYPLSGVRLELTAPVDQRTRDVLLGACVDLVIGLRPYTAAMR